ncbi:carbohydrate kinase family protein [Streptomyces sp. NPDC046860]|uniref:carbohydrate kinase family protein n=1 Tax=Streptomyces sp. NPDC046860 TaxID=3154495 RepID=UPI0033C04DE7
MRIAVTGSIATDHLAVFPGRFRDQILAQEVDHISLSFLVDDLEVRRGGVGANIALGLGRLGGTPLLVGAVGADFADHEVRLKEHGVDTAAVHVSATRHTARFMCTTDTDQNQIAVFYAGAMAEAADIDLLELARRHGPFGLVHIGPDAPEAMLRHTRACRAGGVPFAADPSQQLARLTDGEVRELVDGAAYLFTNEYEAALLVERTGWSHDEVLTRTGTWLTTLGGAGVRVERAGEPPVRHPAVPARHAVDPTGVGDAFRAGYLAAVGWGVSPEAAAALGCGLATLVLEAKGPQEYEIDAVGLLGRIAAAYGDSVALSLAPRLTRVRAG